MKQFCFVLGFLLFAILLITLLYHLTALLPYQRLLLSPRLLMEARITVAFPCLGRWRATILDVFGVKARKILKQNFDQDAVGGLVWCGNMNWKILQAIFRTAWRGGVTDFWNLITTIFPAVHLNMKDLVGEAWTDLYLIFFVSVKKTNEDFAAAKSLIFPPHPSRFACHLPRHGKATAVRSSINRREESNNF